MFKKKVWKRGDKLNAKELNRIEEGIAGGGNIALVSVDVDTTNMMTTGLSYSNWSITPDNFKKLCEQEAEIHLTVNIVINDRKVQVLWASANHIEGYKYSFLIYIKDVGLAVLTINYDTDSAEIKGTAMPKILVPDAD